MDTRTKARMEARVRKHTEDISRSLEKICNIIDEHTEIYAGDWSPVPEFLTRIPMRYRAGGYVFELMAMGQYEYEGLNKVELSEVSNALSKALDQAEDVTYALSDVVNGRETNNRQSDSVVDDETLKSIMNNMVSSIQVPHLDKVTKNCISALLRKEIQTVINNKVSRAKASIGIYYLPEDGRVTRSRSRHSISTRSDSPHTITPTSSWGFGDAPADSGWGAYCDGCSSGCSDCLPDLKESASGDVYHSNTWGCNDPGCECPEPKISRKSNKVSADARSASKRHGNSKTSSQAPEKPARRRRGWSATSSDSGFPIFRNVKTMSLDDNQDLDYTTRVPEPKIYTATTASPASTDYAVPKLHIANLDVVEAWDDTVGVGCQRREALVLWSNGSHQTMWMDELSKKYSQELIEYYEKALPSKSQQQTRQNQLRPQGAPGYYSHQPTANQYGVPRSPVHTQWPSQYSPNTVSNPGVHPSRTGHGSGFNNTNTPRYYSGPVGMIGDSTGQMNPGGNGYNAPPTMPNYPVTGAQPGGAHGPNRYDPALAIPRHSSFGAW